MDAWARKGWIDLRPANAAVWLGRLAKMIAARAELRTEGSAAASIHTYLGTHFEIGEVVAWIFNNEMAPVATWVRCRSVGNSSRCPGAEPRCCREQVRHERRGIDRIRERKRLTPPDGYRVDMPLLLVVVLTAAAGGRSDADVAGTTRFTLPFHELDDAALRVLDDRARRARVVGLGETVHRSHGFAAARARVTRYLVEHHGFRVLALEADWIASDALDAWLTDCERVPARWAMHAARVEVYHDPALEQLLDWACSFNCEHPEDRIRFAGVDIAVAHDAPAAAGGDPALATELMSCARGGERARCDAALGRVELDDPLREIAASNLRANARMSCRGSAAAINDPRDLAMSDVLDASARWRWPDAKTVLWAHNEHLARAGSGFDALGAHLTARHGEAYVAVGVSGYDVDAAGPFAGVMGRPRGRRVERVVEGTPSAWVDLDSVDRRWRFGRGRVDPRDRFDALILVQQSPPSPEVGHPPAPPAPFADRATPVDALVADSPSPARLRGRVQGDRLVQGDAATTLPAGVLPALWHGQEVSVVCAHDGGVVQACWQPFLAPGGPQR